jgi:hypothetical protein
VLLGGCGGGRDHARATPSPTAFPPTLQTADCDQWHELRPASRRQLVEQMTLFFHVLANGCRPAYAGAVKLYKLYGRAAAFTP